MMLAQRQLILVTGPGGNRKDFVVGWLGKLQQFDDTSWSIDLTTGCSGILNEFSKLDQDQTVTDIIQRMGFELDPAANRFLAGGCHGSRWDQAGTETYAANGSLRTFHVDISTADIDTVHWEFGVKTWLTNRRWQAGINRPVWDIDFKINKSVITDQDRILATKRIIERHNSSANPQIGIKLDYNKLFCAGGSHYLCDQMKITATAKEHQFWDAMLPFCQSPDEIVCWGQVWRKQDYVSKFMCNATRAA